MSTSSADRAASMDSFNAARRRAFVQDILADLSGRPDELLSFADVEAHLSSCKRLSRKLGVGTVSGDILFPSSVSFY